MLRLPKDYFPEELRNYQVVRQELPLPVPTGTVTGFDPNPPMPQPSEFTDPIIINRERE
jgi:hypothetical protein